MNKQKCVIAALVLVLVLVTPQLIRAEDEITLEGLAERVTELINRVEKVEQRLTELDVVSEIGYCAPSVSGYHPMTLVGIADEFPEYEVHRSPDISSLQLNMETGEIVVRWQTWAGLGGDEIVIEYYNGLCQWEGFQFKAGG